jgi:hypothetical protein
MEFCAQRKEAVVKYIDVFLKEKLRETLNEFWEFSHKRIKSGRVR